MILGGRCPQKRIRGERDGGQDNVTISEKKTIIINIIIIINYYQHNTVWPRPEVPQCIRIEKNIRIHKYRMLAAVYLRIYIVYE